MCRCTNDTLLEDLERKRDRLFKKKKGKWNKPVVKGTGRTDKCSVSMSPPFTMKNLVALLSKAILR